MTKRTTDPDEGPLGCDAQGMGHRAHVPDGVLERPARAWRTRNGDRRFTHPEGREHIELPVGEMCGSRGSGDDGTTDKVTTSSSSTRRSTIRYGVGVKGSSDKSADPTMSSVAAGIGIEVKEPDPCGLQPRQAPPRRDAGEARLQIRGHAPVVPKKRASKTTASTLVRARASNCQRNGGATQLSPTI